ncbi:MAG TPA: DNA polymerase III subunit epsilon [Rudaea sp.]|nr:DNA polymerase III subunit epsilon [Rudaea sp.]
MRQVVLDTETTGLEVGKGHRVIEIGAVELVERRPTGRSLHRYVNPQRAIDGGALAVHGISDEFLADKPTFAAIAHELLEFVAGAELVIHNAAFDVAFLDAELALCDGALGTIGERAAIVDTLALAREKYPGQKNSLDALCKRLGVDNSHRELHGALLDAQLLAEVYLAMTGGQGDLAFASETERTARAAVVPSARPPLRVRIADAIELALHAARLDRLQATSKGRCLWLQS